MPSSINEIRECFKSALLNKHNFIVDKSGVQVIELIGTSFIADESTIFGNVDYDYCRRELEWYESMSLNVNDIPSPVPQIWKAVATPDGRINSNYGWCIFSIDNGSQFDNCLFALLNNKSTRRAEMIYTRPSMQVDFFKDGMSDFMCTEVVQYFIRDNRLHAIVKMRSNDAIFGYKNDLYWQKHVLNKLRDDYNRQQVPSEQIEVGDIIWQAGSLHIYERHFHLIK